MDVRRLDEMQAQGRSIFDTELAVAYYARVSTDKDEQINSLGNQKRYFEDYIAANPHWTFAGGYVDEGISGTSVEGREQFLRMIEDAKRGRFDLIITKEISRFARNTLDSLSYTRELLRFGVGVYFQNDNINTFDKDAELRLTIMSSIAQDEVRKLSERTRFGFKRAQENSVLLGQNNLFGYNKVDGRLEIVDHEAAIVREVFERYTAGDLGLRAIANDLERRGIRGRQGRPLTYSTLYGMIRNPKYKGCYAGRRYASRDYRDKRSYRLSEDKWLVHEDDRVHKSKSRGEVECWNCKLYREKGKQGGCDSPTIYSHELDRILARVFEQVTDERSTAMQEYIDNLRAFAAQQDNAPALAKVEQELETVTRRKDKLLDLALAGALSNEEFRQRNEACNEQLAALEQQRKELQNADKTLEQRIRRVESLRRTIEERWQTNCGFSREMSKALVDRIVVDADESRTCIRLEIFLTTGSDFRAEPVLSAATQSPDAQMKLTFPRSRSGHQGEYSVTYLVRWHLG